MPADLKEVPLWSKILIGGIFFAYCGGMEILDAVSSHFQGDSLRLVLLIPVVILVVTAYCSWSWWDAKKKTSSRTWKARDLKDSPVEMVHGKLRMKRKGPVAAMPSRKTASQLKGRRPSKKYGIDIGQAPTSPPFEVAQIGLSRETTC